MEGRSKLLLQSLERFYDDPKNGSKLLDIINHRINGISLRTIEWFVTNYAKKNNVSYKKEISGRVFTVHIEYKSTLEGYSKKLFDPFCRTERIDFVVNGETIKTTIGQLNFVRWCIQNNIIEHTLKEVETKKTNAKNLETNTKVHTTDTTEDPRGCGGGEVRQPLEISG